MPQYFSILGAFLAFLAVVGGAFGAHLLKNHLGIDSFRIFETGIRYQFFHALALCLVGFRQELQSLVWFTRAGWCFLAGILLFSGSLYGLAVTSSKWLGPVTPLGGLAFLAGWVCFMRGEYLVKKIREGSSPRLSSE